MVRSRSSSRPEAQLSRFLAAIRPDEPGNVSTVMEVVCRHLYTMEIYTEVSDDATRAGLKKLGDSLA